jgi:hypothetical protein
MYRTYKGAQAELDEKIVIVKSIWLKTSEQLDFIKSIEAELTLEHLETHVELVRSLCNKLSTACAKLEALQKKQIVGSNSRMEPSMRRLKYTFTKSNVEETIRELEKWQELYDPTWYLILRMSKQSIDTGLRTTSTSTNSITSHAAMIREALKPQSATQTSVFLSSSRLKEAKMQVIPFSTARWSQLPGTESRKFIIVDRISCGGMDPNLITRAVRTLAVKLENADPTRFNLLHCRGVVRVYNDAKALQGFDMILDWPKGAAHMPRSLRSSLLSRCKHNLSDRFALARQLANATNYVHMFGFVHKGIRPENAFYLDDNASRLGPCYLTGFEHTRLADGRTNRAGEADLWKDIYKHPSRQGLYPYEDYCMQHDIYSLGVCLLEIGLWTSFITYDISSMPKLNTKVLNIDEAQGSLSGQALKSGLLKLARAELPSSMGSVYAEIVSNCLTCLDEENDDFGDKSEFEDEDGILIGLRYIEKVRRVHISRDPLTELLTMFRFFRGWAASRYDIEDPEHCPGWPLV